MSQLQKRRETETPVKPQAIIHSTQLSLSLHNRPEAKSVFSVLTCWLNFLLQISCFQRHLLFGRNYSSRYSGLFGEKVRWSRPKGLNQSNFLSLPPSPPRPSILSRDTFDRHNWVDGREGRVTKCCRGHLVGRGQDSAQHPTAGAPHNRDSTSPKCT